MARIRYSFDREKVLQHLRRHRPQVFQGRVSTGTASDADGQLDSVYMKGATEPLINKSCILQKESGPWEPSMSLDYYVCTGLDVEVRTVQHRY